MGFRYVAHFVIIATLMAVLAGCSRFNPTPVAAPTWPSLSPGTTFVPPRPAGTSVISATTPIPLAENKPRLVIRDFVQDTDEQRWTLINLGDAPASLAEWHIVIGTKRINRKPFPDDLTLAPNQKLVVHTMAGESSQTDFYLGFEPLQAVHYWVPGDPAGGQIEIRTRDENRSVAYPIPRPKS